MKNRVPILVLAILLVVSCLYHLSFTFFNNNVNSNAEVEVPKKLDKLISDNISKAIIDFDSLNKDIDSISRLIEIDKIKESIESTRDLEYDRIAREYKNGQSFLGLYSYKQSEKNSLNLGLDLKGGMNLTLEVSVRDILISLAPGRNKKNKNLLAALDYADESIKQNSQKETMYIDFFQNAIFPTNINDDFYSDMSSEEKSKIVGQIIFHPDSSDLKSLFLSRKLSKDISNKNIETNQQMIDLVLRGYVEDAIGSFVEVLRTRIDKFGVTQPNLQTTAVEGRVIVELPGIEDPERAKSLLQTSAKLEFWETHNFSEIYDDFSNAVESSSEFSSLISEEFFIPNITSEGTPSESPVIGYVQADQKYKFDSLINDDYFLNLWTTDPYLTYGIKQDLNNGEEAYPVLSLRKYGIDGYRIDGSVISDADVRRGQNNQLEINMEMLAPGENGEQKWFDITEDNVGRSVAVVLDGEVKSFPNVNEPISGGVSQISGAFSLQEANDLANVLKSGKLPARAEIVQSSVVGPSLGQEAINSGLESFIIALILVLMYMIFYYYGAGLVSNVALLANIFFIFGTLASLGAALTLPGIAGIVLTIGMSVDANVLIFERIREEIANGKGIQLAIADGYKNAYTSIIDANVTTLLTGIVLYTFGSGPIQGFATTLIIGILTSLFSAIFITRLIISYRLNKGKKIVFDTKLTKGAFKNVNIDFIGKRKIFYILSSILILFGSYNLFVSPVFGEKNNEEKLVNLDFGIDFEGGRTFIVNFDNINENSDLRSVSRDDILDHQINLNNDLDLKIVDYTVDINDENTRSQVKYPEGTFYKISTKDTDYDMSTFFSGLTDMQIMGEETVSATISQDIQDDALFSIIFSLIVIFIYIFIRFKKWQFSLGAVAAVFHDVLLVLSVFSIFREIVPFSLDIDQAFIAAILTIIGYSLNDTVVVFDRVREYMNNNKKKQVFEIINQSLNSTLSRTINTSLTTFVSLLVIFLFGGEAIQGFMFALMVGVAVGTYSSLFVASPIMLDTIGKKKIS